MASASSVFALQNDHPTLFEAINRMFTTKTRGSKLTLDCWLFPVFSQYHWNASWWNLHDFIPKIIIWNQSSNKGKMGLEAISSKKTLSSEGSCIK